MKIASRINLITILMAVCLLFSMLAVAADKNEDAVPATSVAMDSQGKLWRVATRDGFVEVASSDDLGKQFSPPLRLHVDAQHISVQAQSRPRLAIADKGNIYVAWTQLESSTNTSHLWFVRSDDGGKNFAPASKLPAGETQNSRQLSALTIAPTGRLYLAWSAETALAQQAATASNPSAPGNTAAAIYYAVSDDGGLNFQPQRKLADTGCPSSAMALARDNNGDAVALWRGQFEHAVQDYAIARINASSQAPEIKRASFSNRQADACASQAAALALGGLGAAHWGWHMAWLTGGAKAGLFYARMDDAAWVASPPKRFSTAPQQAESPSLLSQHTASGDEYVWLVWKESADGVSTIKLAYSGDGGRNWEDTRVAATANGRSGLPQLLTHGSKVYMAWSSEQYGLQVMEVLAQP